MTFIRLLSGIAAFTLGATRLSAQTNSKCPIMTETEADSEFTVEFEGRKVLLCCDKCAKLWEKNPRYVIKASAKFLPQFDGMEDKLELAKVKLMDQRFCPMRLTAIVTPDSPSVEYKGVTIYLFDRKAVEKWNTDPEGYAKKGIEAGLLPQLAPAAAG